MLFAYLGDEALMLAHGLERPTRLGEGARANLGPGTDPGILDLRTGRGEG